MRRDPACQPKPGDVFVKHGTGRDYERHVVSLDGMNVIYRTHYPDGSRADALATMSLTTFSRWAALADETRTL